MNYNRFIYGFSKHKLKADWKLSDADYDDEVIMIASFDVQLDN